MTPADSAQHDILQVADMVAGALANAQKHGLPDTSFSGKAKDNVVVMQITPKMEKPTK